MSIDFKQRAVDLLKSLETKAPEPFQYLNATHLVQHNLVLGDGTAGVAELIKMLGPETRVNTVRVFQDDEYVFTHTDYNLFGPKIGFDLFRIEGDLFVEHWDNLQETPAAANPSGHTMIDGPTEIKDLDKTEENKALMFHYMDDLTAGRRDTFPSYFNGTNYIQHNPGVADTVPGLISGVRALAAQGKAVEYKRIHKILGEGNFVLVLAEATIGGAGSVIYDLYRIENGKIAEHWDTIEQIPPRSEWKNGNGKF